MESLALELQREAYQSNTSVTDLIRKAFVLARKLDVKELISWVNREMEGYKEINQEEVPTYRLVHGHIKAWNPYQGCFIPAIFGGETDETLSKQVILLPIAEIEKQIENANARNGNLKLIFPPALQIELMKATGYDFEVSLHVPVSQFENILNRVRDIILEWTLSLEEKGIIGENMTFNADEKKSASQITNIHNHIGTMINSPLQQNSNNSSQIVSVGEFKVESLKEIVEQGKVLLEQITDTEVKAELQADLAVLETQFTSPKPKNGIIKESLASIRNIAEGITGSLLATGIVEKIIPLLATL
ncbi:hypothetical protein ACIQ57_17325 [Lysinibacillus xylanilyticus]|uniref:AbiTii domain-containing protein n=1 Tax=Lysinibacillus xylanilyticus TaxID=582475 RepID=UPI00381AC88F